MVEEIIIKPKWDNSGVDDGIAELKSMVDKLERSTGKTGTANRRMADEGERKVLPFIRKYRWGLSLLLITQNAIYRLAQGTKILAGMLNLITKAIGFLVDMALLPFVPLIVMLAVWIFKLGEWLKNLPEPFKTLSNAIIGIIAALIIIGVVGGWIFSALTNIYAALGWLIARVSSLAVQYLPGMYATLMGNFFAMGLLGQAAVVLGSLLIASLIVNTLLASGALDSLHDSLYESLMGFFELIESIPILGIIIEELIKGVLELGVALFDILTGRWGDILPDMKKVGRNRVSDIIGTPGQTWEGIQSDKTELDAANALARARQSTWGQAPSSTSGSAPQTSISGSAQSQGLPAISANTININLTGVRDVDELVKNVQEKVLKNTVRNVTPTR